MEQNLPLITKKLWKMFRVAFYMLKKGICKNKILFTLNMMVKRGKIASKVALNNLLFHHHHNYFHSSTTRSGRHQPSHIQHSAIVPAEEYILSGGATPLCIANKTKKGYQYEQDYYYSCMSTPIFEDLESLEVINRSVQIMLANKKSGVIVKQVRITDSPFPMQNEEHYDHYVDKTADNFIKKFYTRLKEQES